MKKKILSVLLCLSMAVGMLAGCGKGEAEETFTTKKDGAEETFITKKGGAEETFITKFDGMNALVPKDEKDLEERFCNSWGYSDIESLCEAYGYPDIESLCEAHGYSDVKSFYIRSLGYYGEDLYSDFSDEVKEYFKEKSISYNYEDMSTAIADSFLGYDCFYFMDKGLTDYEIVIGFKDANEYNDGYKAIIDWLEDASVETVDLRALKDECTDGYVFKDSSGEKYAVVPVVSNADAEERYHSAFVLLYVTNYEAFDDAIMRLEEQNSTEYGTE